MMPLVAAEVARADDDQARVRLCLLDTDVGAEQVLQPLALLRPAHEQDVRLAVLNSAGARAPLEVFVIDAVRDDVEVPGEVAADETGGRRRDGDLAIQFAEPAPREARGVAVETVAAILRRVERANFAASE